jgi:hypothetical protein
MVIENFKNRDPVPVYRRFRDCGRLAPEGLQYVSSWVDEKLERCFQLMEADDRKLLDEWIARWSDIVEFEIYPVLSSKEAAEKVSSRLSRTKRTTPACRNARLHDVLRWQKALLRAGTGSTRG